MKGIIWNKLPKRNELQKYKLVNKERKVQKNKTKGKQLRICTEKQIKKGLQEYWPSLLQISKSQRNEYEGNSVERCPEGNQLYKYRNGKSRIRNKIK